MGQGQLSEIAQALKGLNSALRVTPFGSHQIGLGLQTREVRVGWVPTQATFFSEFWSKDVLSGKLSTRHSDVVLQIARAWLLSESNLAITLKTPAQGSMSAIAMSQQFSDAPQQPLS
jgi:hypothetical protein